MKDYFTEGSSGVCVCVWVWGIRNKQNTGVSKANSASSHIWVNLSLESILIFSEWIQNRWRENHDASMDRFFSPTLIKFTVSAVNFSAFSKFNFDAIQGGKGVFLVCSFYFHCKCVTVTMVFASERGVRITCEESTTWFSHSGGEGSSLRFTVLHELIGQLCQDMCICQTQLNT